MSKALNIWLWIIFVLNIIGCVTTLATALFAPLTLVSLLFSIAYVVGIAMLLFKKRLAGFYLMCASQVICTIYNIVVFHSNILLALISMIIPLAIVYFLMKPDWNSFQ